MVAFGDFMHIITLKKRKQKVNKAPLVPAAVGVHDHRPLSSLQGDLELARDYMSISI